MRRPALRSFMMADSSACAHSNGRNISVTLTYGSDFSAHISDDGIGVPPSMMERATVHLLAGQERTLPLDEEAEQKLLAVAGQPLQDLIVLARDAGMRNALEIYALRMEHVNWRKKLVRVPDSKTRAWPSFCSAERTVRADSEGPLFGRVHRESESGHGSDGPRRCEVGHEVSPSRIACDFGRSSGAQACKWAQSGAQCLKR